MSTHIIIDGYNLIRQSLHFREMDRYDMQTAREALVDVLAAYKKVKGFPITVVFDGGGAGVEMPRRDTLKGIQLRFSRAGELADAVIKRMAHQEKEKALVVSSDHDIVRYAQFQGAAVVSTAEFEERLMFAQYMDRKGGDETDENEGWQVSTKKRGPSRRLSKQQRQQLRKRSKL